MVGDWKRLQYLSILSNLFDDESLENNVHELLDAPAVDDEFNSEYDMQLCKMH